MMLRVWTFALVWVVYLSEFHPHEMTVQAHRSSELAVIRVPVTSTNRNITIVGNDFMLDGNPLLIISGSIHYFRLPAEYWRDRLRKLKAVGFNAVATYVEWSYHEPEERQYRFAGDRDVARFVRLAAEEGLHVLLRPGPYICAERDLGGLPYWLLSKYPGIKLRTTDKNFISETRTWMAKLFEQMTPLLYSNGGPIILVQVENEYGSYGNSMPYKEQVRDIIKEHVGTNALLYTTDGTDISMLRGGAVPGALTTVDFGTRVDVMGIFRTLRYVLPTGPLMNSEFYPGWLTHWGEELQQVPTADVVETLTDMIGNKTNFNMYLFFGGTNFEFSSGANYGSNYMPDITSYDYDAPLSEAGDPTPKYFSIREAMMKFNPDLKNITPPLPSPKKAYGKVSLASHINLLSLEGRTKLSVRHKEVNGTKLPTFEQLRQRAGLVLYETRLGSSADGILEIKKPRDRVYVYIDGEFQGIIDRSQQMYRLSLIASPTSRLSLLVENQGRINYGQHLHDSKGILGVVKYNGDILSGTWSVHGFNLESVDIEGSFQQSDIKHGPVLFKGEFSVLPEDKPEDSFIDPTGWSKGYIWVNGHNLGRYWPVLGPQVTLYVPGVWLRPGANTIHILELEQPPPDLAVTFIDHPKLNGKTALSSIDPNILISYRIRSWLT